MTGKKQKSWIVTRVVREKFEVEHAENAQEAKDRAENPYSVEVVKETAAAEERWELMATRKIAHEKCAPLQPTPHEDAALGLFERRTYGRLLASAYCDYCGDGLNRGDEVVALTCPQDAAPNWERDYMEGKANG